MALLRLRFVCAQDMETLLWTSTNHLSCRDGASRIYETSWIKPLLFLLRVLRCELNDVAQMVKSLQTDQQELRRQMSQGLQAINDRLDSLAR